MWLVVIWSMGALDVVWRGVLLVNIELSLVGVEHRNDDCHLGTVLCFSRAREVSNTQFRILSGVSG